MNLAKPILCALLISVAAPVSGQDQARTLEDIRIEVESLSAQITGLRSELLASSAASGTTTSGSPLLRVDAIEAELRTLTGQVEEMRYRIDQVVKDGTNRIGDLEFRLTELEGGDPSSIGQTSELGGDSSNTDTVSSNPELTITEETDFNAALGAYEAGNYADAANKFEAFEATYPGGPMTANAQYLRGLSLAQLQDWKAAGRSFLNSFSNDPDSETAPETLYWLGVSLGRLEKTQQACQTLGEVKTRFPDHSAAQNAGGEMQNLGCS